MTIFSRARNGFTLLELLVTISIIGILIALGTVSFTTAQRRGRDSRRQNDMTNFRNALEQYYSLHTAYPLDCTDEVDLAAVFPSGLPVDPKPDQDYVVECSATTYCVCAALENPDSGNATDDSCGNTDGESKDYFCQRSLQ